MENVIHKHENYSTTFIINGLSKQTNMGHDLLFKMGRNGNISKPIYDLIKQIVLDANHILDLFKEVSEDANTPEEIKKIFANFNEVMSPEAHVISGTYSYKITPGNLIIEIYEMYTSCEKNVASSYLIANKDVFNGALTKDIAEKFEALFNASYNIKRKRQLMFGKHVYVYIRTMQ